MRIGIDIDDTLTNTLELQKKYWKEYYNLNPIDRFTEEVPDCINAFGDEYINEFWDTYREELSFNSIPKVGVSDALKVLRREHTIVIITSRPDSKYVNLHTRLENWFNDKDILYDEIATSVLDKGKYMLEHNIDVLIDDDIRHIKSAITRGLKGILFNDILNYDGISTTNWSDIPDIIEKLKEQ